MRYFIGLHSATTRTLDPYRAVVTVQPLPFLCHSAIMRRIVAVYIQEENT